jgi:hypothetical protein
MTIGIIRGIGNSAFRVSVRRIGGGGGGGNKNSAESNTKLKGFELVHWNAVPIVGKLHVFFQFNSNIEIL